MERQLQEPNCGYQGRCQAAVANEDGLGNDFLPMTHKLEFSKFDSLEDPLPWLNWCEHYFRIPRPLDHNRILCDNSPKPVGE
jgi:hypothetical protein